MTSGLEPGATRRKPSGLKVGAAFIFIALVGVTVFTVVQRLNGEVPTKGLLPADSRKATTLAMPTLEGKDWSLAEHSGGVVVVNYFATWCPPCVQELPEFRKMSESYKGRGVSFVGVAMNSDGDGQGPRAEVLKKFFAFNPLPFPVLLPGPESPLMQDPMPIPQTFLVDKKGRIAWHVVGATDGATLRPLLERLLAE